MHWENFIVITNTGMTNESSIGESLKSYQFYVELTPSEWVSALYYSTIDGFENNLDAMLHFGKITLERLEHYEEYEKCKKLNNLLKLYEPVARKTLK